MHSTDETSIRRCTDGVADLDASMSGVATEVQQLGRWIDRFPWVGSFPARGHGRIGERTHILHAASICMRSRS